MKTMRKSRRQGGFAYIAAVVLLVVVAGAVAAMLRLTSAQQGTVNDAVLIARAGQAARGGVEWMMYRLAATAANVPATLCAQPGPVVTPLSDFVADTGFKVSVGCSARTFNEGVNPATGAAVSKTIYTIDAVACNGSAAGCPDNNGAGAPDYTERRRVATICVVTGTTSDCQ